MLKETPTMYLLHLQDTKIYIYLLVCFASIDKWGDLKSFPLKLFPFHFKCAPLTAPESPRSWKQRKLNDLFAQTGNRWVICSAAVSTSADSSVVHSVSSCSCSVLIIKPIKCKSIRSENTICCFFLHHCAS